MIENTGHPSNSYYTATAQRLAPQPLLEGERRADICIVGAGYTGLGAALTFAERGFSVIVLEEAQIGSGASGRNGGQIHTGHRRDQDYLEGIVGLDGAKALWRLAEDAKSHLKGLISTHKIACDYQAGKSWSQTTSRITLRCRWPMSEKLRTVYGYDQVEALSKQDLDAKLGASGYYGGFLDHDGGHLHPLNFALGLAGAALAGGVQIYERSKALSYEARGAR